MSFEENLRHIEPEIVTEQIADPENPDVDLADLRVLFRIVLLPAVNVFVGRG